MQKQKRFFGLSKNVIWMGLVSLFNDLSSDMIFPFIPIFLTTVLGASMTFVGLIEGVADATASLLKIASGRVSDRWQKRKPFIVFGYSLSALAKPLLALAMAPWHVLGLRVMDRIGKGTREAPRDALISFSVERKKLARAFGFHRGMDTVGAAFGPLIAFLILPFINQNYRILFLISFAMSFVAVLIIVFFVREVRAGSAQAIQEGEIIDGNAPEEHRSEKLGLPFFIFLGVATLASLGKASEAFLILKANEIGVALLLIPILYFVFNISLALLSTPIGIMADRIGKRNTFVLGLLIFGVTYLGFGFAATPTSIWFLFILYGVYAALTEGVGRAIVAGFVHQKVRATAYGLYNAFTGLALLPASVIFGYLNQHLGSPTAFLYGACLAFLSALLFFAISWKMR